MNPHLSKAQSGRRSTLALIAVAAGLGAPGRLLAQTPGARPDVIKRSKTEAEALRLAGVVNPSPGRQILLEAPDILVTGEAAEIRVESRMPGTDWIMLLAEGRPAPVIEVLEFTPGEGRQLLAKVELSKTTRFRAVARSAGRYFVVAREVKVAAAGCHT